MSRNPPKIDEWNELWSPWRTSAARVLSREIHRHYPHLVGHPTVEAGLARFDSLPFRVFGSGARARVLETEETLLAGLHILASLGPGPFRTRTALARALIRAVARVKRKSFLYAATLLAWATEECRMFNWALYPAILSIANSRGALKRSYHCHEEKWRAERESRKQHPPGQLVDGKQNPAIGVTQLGPKRGLRHLAMRNAGRPR